MEEQEDKLRKVAKERVANKLGLLIHAICWLIISVIIIIVVPEQEMGVRIGVLVLGFWGICVTIHAVCVYFILRKTSGKKTEKSFDKMVDKEYEKLKSKQDKE